VLGDVGQQRWQTQDAGWTMETGTDAWSGQFRCVGRCIGLMLGRVRLAKNVNTGQLAAVKIVPKSLTPTARKKDDGKHKAPEKTGDTGLSYSIEREVVIMKLIEHPNVMSLYDVWENRGELYEPQLSTLTIGISYWNILKEASCLII